MTKTTRISNFDYTQESGDMHLILVTEIVADEEEIAGVAYRLRRNGETQLAGEIENIAYNLYHNQGGQQ